MADFSTPFARDAERRLATTDEKQNGFPCGAASQPLFNGLLWQIWSELNAIHQAGGVAGDDTAVNTTLLNIQALIDSATGEGDTTGYLLLSQAVARLPIFPEFLTSDGRINVSSPATGTIRLPGAVSFLHRGISAHVTTQTDFPTDISKTYHLRWNPTSGFELKDLAGVSYNPGALSETDVSFDSKYDDMLISRIITNSSNVATIDNLINKDRHTSVNLESESLDNPMSNTTQKTVSVDLNFARTPVVHHSFVSVGVKHSGTTGQMNPSLQHDHDQSIIYTEKSRYKLNTVIARDYANSISSEFISVM